MVNQNNGMIPDVEYYKYYRVRIINCGSFLSS